jgi:hypothetical protein
MLRVRQRPSIAAWRPSAAAPKQGLHKRWAEYRISAWMRLRETAAVGVVTGKAIQLTTGHTSGRVPSERGKA